jgi:hypothetical protein
MLWNSVLDGEDWLNLIVFRHYSCVAGSIERHVCTSERFPLKYYAVMLLRNASHSLESPKLPHDAHLERVAFPGRALLES